VINFVTEGLSLQNAHMPMIILTFLQANTESKPENDWCPLFLTGRLPFSVHMRPKWHASVH
jgi:hypothetical protein